MYNFLSFYRLSVLFFSSLSLPLNPTTCCQAGMIRAGQEEFFIEPLEREADMTGEEEGGSGRHHIVYRSSDIKRPPVNQPADFHPKGQVRSTFPFMTSQQMHADDKGKCRESELFLLWITACLLKIGLSGCIELLSAHPNMLTGNN